MDHNTDLLTCRWRVETVRENVFFCQHSRKHVRDCLVTPKLCKLCPLVDKPCEPRPIPENLTEIVTAAGLKQAKDNLPPGYGPGTELKKLFKTMGLKPKSSCQCDARAAKMDRNGIQWCRDNRDTILGWLAEGYDHAGWLEKLKAGALAVTHGLPLTLEGILDEAIRRAEAKQ